MGMGGEGMGTAVRDRDIGGEGIQGEQRDIGWGWGQEEKGWGQGLGTEGHKGGEETGSEGGKGTMDGDGG